MHFNQKGQSLVEGVVALVTILLILTAIAIVLVNGLYNSRFIKDQNEANKYAQQGIELVRNIQRNDIVTFKDTYCGNPSPPCTNTSTWCIDSANNFTQNATTCNGFNIAGTQFHRTVSFSQGTGSQCSVSELLVTVTVGWKSSKCPAGSFCHESKVVACVPFIYPKSQP